MPIEKFDFIVVDECHRSIYNLWRQVLEYFDAFLIGLTATPAPQTIATSLSIEPEDFDYAPFSQKGGLGKAHQIFGDHLPQLLEELNDALAA